MISETKLPLRPKPKGILKKTSGAAAAAAAAAPLSSASNSTTPPFSNEEEQQQQQQQRQQQTAPLTRQQILLHQEQNARLRLLQKLRDTELKPPVPLETFERLAQLPSSPTSSASSPSAADTSLFLTKLADFQPSEYLDLIEERNCLGKCGYTLCPRPRRTHAGAFKITSGSGGSIAKTSDLNKWCSDACALRALYLKVQLDNPSYVRKSEEENGNGSRIVVQLELREEKKKKKNDNNNDNDNKKKDGEGNGNSREGVAAAAVVPRGSEEDRNQLAQAMVQLEIDKQKQARKDASALAGERGDAAEGILVGVSRVEVTITEKAVDGPAEPPSKLPEGAEWMIEGYMPNLTRKKQAEDDESDDDDDDDDFFTVRI